MPGRLDARSLESLVRSGDIDTVLTVVLDGYGRLLGKRIAGRHLVDQVLEHGVHACAPWARRWVDLNVAHRE